MSKRFKYCKCGGIKHKYNRTEVCGVCGTKWFAGVVVRQGKDLPKEKRA